MSIELITLLLVATFIVLLLTGLPLAWVMGATAVIFCLTLYSPALMVMMVGRVYHMMLNYALVAVPLFILMASILQQSGVADQLFKAVDATDGYQLVVDLQAQTITTPDGDSIAFEVDAFRKHCLLEGLDDIGLTLQHDSEIDDFEAKQRSGQPWLYGSAAE